MTLAELQALDRTDPLAPKRAEFLLPEGVIYLDGNSLGALPKRVVARMEQVVQAEWGQSLIKSWNLHGWIDLPQRVGARIARLIGAEPDEVIAADSTSVNLFKVLLAALELRPGRRVIVSDIDNFPTDLYIAQGIAELRGGYELRFVKKDQLEEALDEQTAVLMLTEVDYRTGYLYDMARLTRLAQQKGALTIWDLAHSAGALPVQLNRHGVDFAVGCGYKYLNGGPGAPAFLFVARRHQEATRPFLTGWMGHQAPFAFVPEYLPALDIRRLTVGTPGVLSMSALEAALEVFEGVEMEQVRQKSLQLTDLFIELMEPLAARYGFQLATPREHHRRGSQVAYRHPEGYAIMQALISQGVVGDFRAPDILRFGFTPLYLRYEDVYHAVQRLEQVMQSGLWQEARFQERAKVT
ncbi:kynureninase [Meiothermus ruber]|uniref:Kynureninase n=1 Tax=Meiothermus ruber (strain ATCC 35948 / DSM 1279 / VKM B-1258 / 21) TaxID=504728 RepID=D3PTT9_MEIRD|nr:kynureninase [Meiothermus ruber]ADD28872.1 kynureninase [Meiothermus ruber DSM 1279]AGK05679.1 kynureninase [Meiothermus ruber DSM 1279]MCL6530846.1 kynureninase [Meiothermus ruber]GAO75787.1 kynureninase [Meiothermus ruber H328]